VVLELEGALFFGNAERVADEAQALPAGCRFLVLDLRRVSAIDESGAMVLQQLALRLARQAVPLLLAGVAPGSAHQQALTTFGAAGPAGTVTWFFDADQAVEAAERRLLDAAHPGINTAGSAVTLAECSLLHGLSAEQQATLSNLLTRYVLEPGERLFEEGDIDNGLYVLTSGSVSVRSALGQRLVSFSPGTMFGEMALLDGQRRSAAAYADSQSEVHLLGRTEFAAIAVTDPVLCVLLYRNIAVHLSERLRAASSAWRSAAT
jgi:sulfate permease, SulP family